MQLLALAIWHVLLYGTPSVAFRESLGTIHPQFSERHGGRSLQPIGFVDELDRDSSCIMLRKGRGSIQFPRANVSSFSFSKNFRSLALTVMTVLPSCSIFWYIDHSTPCCLR